MARICASAAHVTVWLGEDADESFNMFETLSYLVRTDARRPYEMRLPIFEQPGGINRSFQALLDRHWFKRIWVTLDLLDPH
jgi:hypothetical protein